MQGQNYSQNNTSMVFVFLTHILSQIYTGVFQKLHELGWIITQMEKEMFAYIFLYFKFFSILNLVKI